MNKLFFFPQVAEQTIYLPKFAEQSFFSQKTIASPQESNGRSLITKNNTYLTHLEQKSTQYSTKEIQDI